MRLKVLGLESVNYVSKKTGEPVQGGTVHGVRAPTQSECDRFQGNVCHTIFVSAKMPVISKVKALEIGKEYNFIYEFDGRFNTLVDIEPCEPKKA